MKRRTIAPRRVATLVVATLVAAVGPASLDTSPALGANAPVSGSAVTMSVTAKRTHLDNGADNVALSKHVTVTVSATRNLRDRQGIEVSWKGAEPTRGIIADSNSGKATQQEYPMVLLQCRGTAQQIEPSTCWAPTAPERYQFDYGTAFPAWRLDRYAPAADRAQYAGEPKPRPDRCPSAPQSEHWLPFKAADATMYYGGVNDCAGLPPDAAGLDGTLGLPSNATYAATGLDGTGSARFNVRDAISNSSLGCSDKVACALVVIPIVGISCDVAADAMPASDRPAAGEEADAASARCHKSGAFQPGQLVTLPQNMQDDAVSGGLWWSASNWRNRITVPLTFAPPANVCDLSNDKTPALVYGSELMIQATTQWAPTFCLNARSTPIKHVQTGEPQARNLLGAKSIEAAFVVDPPGAAYSVPTVHAPVALTGFTVGYIIDDAKRDTYTELKLTPRLLAKLMTESYPAMPAIKQSYAALADNPLNVSLDPEFIALNPGIPQGVVARESASTLFSIASDSDVVQAVTSYLNADPEARAWLDGTPDPWGMKVNPNYKGIALPTNSWPLLDTFQPDYPAGLNDCLHDAPVPYLPLVASPTSRLANVALAMQFAIANSQIVCVRPDPFSSAGQKLVAQGRQNKGFRFMIGLTSLADAQRFGLTTAALQSQSTVSPSAKITDASGRTFVKPTDAAIARAVQLFKADKKIGGWPVPYDGMRTTAPGAGAYPGTLLVYADVPTQGLPRDAASAFAELLRFAAGPGQIPGSNTGQLPPGYVPMTAANGMAEMVAYTAAAADNVAKQDGRLPDSPAQAPPPPAPRPSAGPSSGGGTSGGGGFTAGGDGGGSSGFLPEPGDASSAPSTPGRPKPSTAPTAPSSYSAPTAATIGLHSSALRVALITLLVLLLLGPVVAPATVFVARRRSRS